jgi:hypothetical protein
VGFSLLWARLCLAEDLPLEPPQENLDPKGGWSARTTSNFSPGLPTFLTKASGQKATANEESPETQGSSLCKRTAAKRNVEKTLGAWFHSKLSPPPLSKNPLALRPTRKSDAAAELPVNQDSRRLTGRDAGRRQCRPSGTRHRGPARRGRRGEQAGRARH